MRFDGFDMAKIVSKNARSRERDFDLSLLAERLFRKLFQMVRVEDSNQRRKDSFIR